MTTIKETQLIYDRYISRLFFLISLIFLGSIFIAALVYPGQFSFWNSALSDLGNTITIEGYPNLTSRIITAIGMILNSILMMMISIHYADQVKFSFQKVKRWLALVGSFGFIIVIYPNDVNHVLHSIGADAVIGVLYFFNMIFHFEYRPRLSIGFFLLDMIILQAAVFPYAIAFFFNASNKQIYQKLCILGIIFALQRIVTVSEQSFQPKEVLNLFRRFQH